MYAEIPNGTKIEIQGLACWVPPYGMGSHSETAELLPVDVIKRSTKKEDQYWEIQPIPEDFEERVLIEKERQDDQIKQGLAATYTDPELNIIRSREWHRRLYGVWVWINGKPVYLTGMYYFFLNYFRKSETEPLKYRVVDLEYFYFYQHISENPKCIGGIEVRKRRDGKSLRAGAIAYEIASRTKGALCGIQSMDEDSAESFFEKNIVNQFKYLPSFFIPVWDTSAGSTPKGSLRFYKPSIKGKKAQANLRGSELKSKIDYRNAKPKAYDGERVRFLILDESGKVETDVIARHSIVKKCCVDIDRKIIGKMWVTSTVELMGLKFNFKKLWQDSDQYNPTQTGATKTGLCRFFIPADRAGEHDIYGEPLVEQNRAAIHLERQSFVDDPDTLYAEMRKEPLSEAEAFMFSTENCHFNLGLLNQRIWEIDGMPGCIEKGNLIWENGVKFGRALWVKDSNGRFEIPKAFQFDNPEDINNVSKTPAGFKPMNNVKFLIGLDPYGTDETEDFRRSMAAAMVYKKNNPFGENEMFNKSFVCKYHGRPKTLYLLFEDIVKLCWYFGCKLIFESNKSEIERWFISQGLEPFLVKIPGYKQYGIPSTEDNKYTLLAVTEAYIEDNIKKVHFPALIEDWKGFNVKKTQKFDLTMAAGWTLVADALKVEKSTEGKLRPLADYGFKKHKTA